MSQELGYENHQCSFCPNKEAGYQMIGSDGQFHDACEPCIRKRIDSEEKTPRVKVPPAPKPKAPTVEFTL